MDDQIFADGLGGIAIIGSTVRLDFVTLSPTERDVNGQPKAVFRQRVVMSLEGFLRSSSKIQEAAQALTRAAAGAQAAGLTVTSREAQASSDAAPASTELAPAGKKGKPPFP